VDVARLPSVEEKLKQFTVIITPKDPLGNYLGPRYSGVIKLSASQGKFINRLQDNLDGTYTQILQVPPSVNVKDEDITVDVKGETLSFNLAKKLKKPYSVSFQVGSTIPAGNFNNNYDADFSIGLNFDYHLAPQLSAVGLLGYNHFNSGTPSVSDPYWWNISMNLKYEFTTNPLRPYVNAGPGVYIPEHGSTRLGFNAGLGLNYSLNPSWVIELGADYHHIFTSGSDTDFFVPCIGLFFRF
jgi:opacity protein-like surface antigen